MNWMQKYKAKQTKALEKIDQGSFDVLLQSILYAVKNGKSIYVIGNGGSAANASHFAEDLGKGAGDAIVEGHFAKITQSTHQRFRVISLTDSVPYITAIGNDYSFDDIYLRQLYTLARSGDLLIGMSVSGTSPNLVKAFEWASNNRLYTIALTGSKAKKNPDSIYAHARLSIAIEEEHYGIVEDCQMTLCHMICYYIMENLQ